MPLDDVLPPPRLPRTATPEQIVRHFAQTSGLRVDVDELPESERPALSGASLPEPPEAQLLDRVLQVVPAPLLQTVDRILLPDNAAAGPLGGYRSGIIRLYTPALRLHLPDSNYAGRFSLFVTTVLHEIGHAAYDRWLAVQERGKVDDWYLDDLISEETEDDTEPTEIGAEHFFTDLLVAGVLRVSLRTFGPAAVRQRLRDLGIPLA